MLSMEMDAPKISLATPDDFKDASQRAMNIWVGAMSPLWAPFWAATTFGVSLWALGQGLKRSVIADELLDKDAVLALRWPGFAVPFATPWSHSYGEVVEQVDALEAVAYDALSAPVQLAFETEEKLEAAADEAVRAGEAVIGDAKDAPATLFEAAEAAAETALAPVHAISEAAKDAADTLAEETTQATEAALDSAQDATKPLIDPVSEAPVVPAVAEATAETPPMPGARRLRKR